jgi:uncharacterized protein HemY
MKNLAMIYALRLGDEQKGYDFAMKARSSMPRDAELARTLGILSYRRAEYEGTVQYLDQSIRAQPEDAEAQFYKGMAHYRLKQKALGEQSLGTALKLKLDAKLQQEARRALEELGKGS